MRLIIAFFLCVLATAGYAQFPASQQTGAPKTLIKNRGGASADSGTVFSVNFTDTAQANLGFLKGVPHIVIVANDTLWKRNNSATQWVKVGSGGGGGSTVDSFFYQLRQLNDTTVLFDRGDGVVDTLAISGGSGGGGSGLNKVDSVTTVGDSLFYWINGDSFFSANLALSVVNGDTSSLSTVDSTGQPARRVLFSAPNNKISSTRFFLYDTVNNKLVIGTPLISAGTGSKLFVNGNASFQGNVIADTGYLNRVGLVARTITFNSDSMRVNGLDQVADTSRFKPQVYDAVNKTWSYFDRWPVTPSIDTTSLSNRINLKLNISDTAAMLSPYLKVADTVGTGSLYIRNQTATQEAKAFNIRSGRLDSLYANAWAGYNSNVAASYTARSFTDKNYVDSTVAAVPTVTSYGKNSGGDSTILLLSNGQRFAAKDSAGGGGGGGGITSVKQSTAPSDTTTLWIDDSADNNGFEITKLYSNGSWNAIEYKDLLSGYISPLPPLYVLATGQSNMQEYYQAGIASGDLATDNRAQKWNGSAWEVANPTPANGLAFQFAKRVAKNESRVVRYINVALNGAGIENWYDGATVDASITSAITASGVDSIDVILFRQGESNPADTESQYKTKVDSVVKVWRSRSWFNNIRPIVAGGLKTTNSGATLENYGSQKFYQNIPYQYKDLGMLYSDNNNINIPTGDIHIYGAGMDSSAARMYAAYTSRSHVLAPQASFTLSNIGNTPNATGATVTGTNLNLEPASASFGGVLTTGPQTIAGPKTLNDTLTIPNFSRITFGSSAGAGIRKRLVFDYLGSETYDIRSSAEFNMILNVPTGKRIDFHAGNYTGGVGNLMQLDPSAITFGAPIGGTYSNLTANTTSGPVGGRVYVRDGGTAARYGMGWTGFEYQFTMPSSGRLSFTTNGNIQDGSVNTLFKDNGWLIYGSTKGSQNGDPGARSALTISTTTQGSIPAPIMTETQRNALSSPPSGLRVFNSTTAQPNYRDGSTWQAQVGMTFGTAAPTSTPTAVGNFFLDTTNKKLYVATGTASSADWNILN